MLVSIFFVEVFFKLVRGIIRAVKALPSRSKLLHIVLRVYLQISSLSSCPCHYHTTDFVKRSLRWLQN